MLVIKARGQDKLCQLLLHRARNLSRNAPAINAVIKSQDQNSGSEVTIEVRIRIQDQKSGSEVRIRSQD